MDEALVFAARGIEHFHPSSMEGVCLKIVDAGRLDSCPGILLKPFVIRPQQAVSRRECLSKEEK